MVEPLPFSPRSPRTIALALALVVTAPASRALAETAGEKTAAAQALFDEAMRLMKAGQAAEACPKLEESQRLDAGMATQFRLAECYEKVGKVASAWASFIAVADAAGVAKLPDREAAARKRADALVSRLSRLTLTVPPAVAALDGLEVQRDGGPVGRPMWGVPVPVDPGDHVVIVRAPGKKPWEGHVTAGDAGGAVSLDVPALEDAPRGAAVAPPSGPGTGPARQRSAVPAIVLGSLAAVSVGVGAAFFAVHASRKSDAQTLSGQIAGGHGTCSGPAPDMRCGTLSDDAKSSDTFGNASTVGFVVAGAAAVGMVTYLLLPAPSAPTTGARSIRVAPVVGPGRAGISAVGSFQ